MTITKAAVRKAAKTPLEKAVARWVVSRVHNWHSADGKPQTYGPAEVFKDLFHGGCQSGIVNELIYTRDCVAFYKRHQKEIAAILYRLSEDTGASYPAALNGFDAEDPICLEAQNQNLLAWVGFEEAARALADALGVEV
jgi:hypothetical protein